MFTKYEMNLIKSFDKWLLFVKLQCEKSEFKQSYIILTLKLYKKIMNITRKIIGGDPILTKINGMYVLIYKKDANENYWFMSNSFDDNDCILPCSL